LPGLHLAQAQIAFIYLATDCNLYTRNFYFPAAYKVDFFFKGSIDTFYAFLSALKCFGSNTIFMFGHFKYLMWSNDFLHSRSTPLK